MKKLALFFILYFLFAFVNAHPFYVSVTQIDYKSNSLQITLKVFIEDLEAALIDQNQPKPNLVEQYENPNSTQIIQNYLDDKFWIKINNKDY